MGVAQQIIAAGGGFSPLAGATAWNPSDKTSSNVALSNGNLTVTNTASSDVFLGVRAVQGRSSGKFYWEIVYDNYVSGSPWSLGMRSSSSNLANSRPDGSGFGFYPANGNILFAGDGGAASGVGTSNVTGTIIGLAVDLTNSTIQIRKNGTWGTLVSFPGGGTLFPHAGIFRPADQLTVNFGSKPFAHDPPVGYTPGFA